MDLVPSTEALLARLDLAGLARGDLVATDADGTLWAADVADVAWHAALAGRALHAAAGPVLRAALEASGAAGTGEPHADAEALYRRYLSGGVAETTMVRSMVGCYAGWTEGALRAFGAEVGRSVAQRAYETTAPLLRGLRARGFEVVVVSGSPRVLVEESLRALGLDPLPSVVGADVRRDGDVLTGDVREPIPWEEGKVAALRGLRAAPPHVALGDTLGDLPLLLAATCLRVLVHPRPGLRTGLAGHERCVHFAPARTVAGAEVRPPEVDRAIAG